MARSFMPKVHLIGFRGAGLRSDRFKAEPLLIRVGHVGWAFEGDPTRRIYGFHPTAETAQAIGDDDAIVRWLKQSNPIPGTLHDDRSIFQRAYVLSQLGAPTVVWQLDIEVPSKAFYRIRDLTLLWYTEQKVFQYGFPGENQQPDRDNCATFVRRLGIPLPEPTGQLIFYISALARQGHRWSPQEDDHGQSDT